MGRVSVGLGATCRARCVHKWGDAQVQFTGVSGVRADGRSARQRHARHADTPHAPGEDGVRELRDVPGAATCMGTVSVSPGVTSLLENQFPMENPQLLGEKIRTNSYGNDKVGARGARAELWQGGRLREPAAAPRQGGVLAVPMVARREKSPPSRRSVLSSQESRRHVDGQEFLARLGHLLYG